MRKLAIGPPPATPDPETEFHWLRPGEDGNVDYVIQHGAGEPVLAFWHGRKDGAHHIARVADLSEEAETLLPAVKTDDIYAAIRVRVEYDGRGPV